MSFEHKAFIFDYDLFDQELRPLLERCLETGSIAPLKAFIDGDKRRFSDPYEGDALDDGWESYIEEVDPHQYGDFALTKYYQPSKDGGVGQNWEELQSLIADGQQISPFLGTPVGPSDNYFDPGKMGSYFQSPRDVKSSFERLRAFEEKVPAYLRDDFQKYLDLLAGAISSGKGLYITF